MSRVQVPPSTPSKKIFRDAVKAYEERTKKDIATHPLAAQLKSCDNPGAILAVLRAQVRRSQSADEKLTKWLDPTVNVLHAFSETIGNAVGLAFPPATVIFAGIGVLLQAIKDVRAGQHALVDLFGSIESFFRRLEIYVNIQPTQAFTDILVKVTAEVLSILGIVTKEIGERRSSMSFPVDNPSEIDLCPEKYIKRLLGLRGTPVEDAVQSLDRLTQEEALMAAAENLKITRGIDNGVKGVQKNLEELDQGIQTVDLKLQGTNDKLQDIGDTLHDFDSDLSSIVEDGKETRMAIRHITNQVSDLNRIITGNDVRINLRSCQWMSPQSPPADPSINYNAACEAHHEGTAAWCTQSNTFADWKASGSLLWIHGKPGSGKSVVWCVAP
ncbi:hypothetical protein EDB85DRAFT_1893942 [Lactarius pseudohatsudake]|nr:hypothetical protein EDB85DRAFT_1893942 [Lactarius pseudohatsudake]